MCILWENSIHMFLSLLYIERFPGEYLASTNFKALPRFPLPVFCMTPSLPTLPEQEFTLAKAKLDSGTAGWL